MTNPNQELTLDITEQPWQWGKFGDAWAIETAGGERRLVLLPVVTPTSAILVTRNKAGALTVLQPYDPIAVVLVNASKLLQVVVAVANKPGASGEDLAVEAARELLAQMETQMGRANGRRL